MNIEFVRSVGEEIHMWAKKSLTCPRICQRDLMGACAISSYVLWKVLKKSGIESNFIQGDFEFEWNAHCWVEIENIIVDITATQFGYDRKVVFSDKSDVNYIPKRINLSAVREVNKYWHYQSIKYHHHKIHNLITKLLNKFRALDTTTAVIKLEERGNENAYY